MDQEVPRSSRGGGTILPLTTDNLFRLNGNLLPQCAIRTIIDQDAVIGRHNRIPARRRRERLRPRSIGQGDHFGQRGRGGREAGDKQHDQH